MKKRLLFWIIVLCLLFSGCGKKEADVATVQTSYVANPCGVPHLQGTINSTLKIDSKLYAGVYTKGIAVEDGRYCVVTYDFSENTNKSTILRGRDEMVMWSFTVLEDGNYKALFYTWDSENMCYSSLWVLTFDQEGNVLEEQDITQRVAEQIQDTITQNSFCFDREGNLYFYTTTYAGTSITSKIYRVQKDGEIQLLKENAGNVLGIQIVSSRLWIAEADGEHTISIYDLEDNQIADLKLSTKSQSMFITDGLTDTQKYIVLDTTVYEYDVDSKQLTELFTYEDVGLELGVFNTGKLIATEQNVFYVIKKTAETEDGGRTYDWVRISESDNISQKEVLTIAVSEQNSSLKEAVTVFNQVSEQYKVVVKVYETDSENNPSALLQADIAAGNIPDMIAVDTIDLDAMINNGLVCDLSDLLEKDPELSKNDFIGKSLDIYTRGDELYALPQCLCVTALTGKQKILDGRDKWTMKEFEEYVHSLPNEKAATMGISRSFMLQIVMEQYMSQFVDWQNKTCSFDSGEFVDLLQFINMYPEEALNVENDVEKLVEMFQSDEIILYPNGITTAFDYQFMKSLWGEDVSYIGFPSATGNGIQLMNTSTAYVITENSSHKEEMWQIIKHIVTNPNLATAGLPAYQPLFDKACEDAMKKNMEKSEDGTMIEKPAMEMEMAGIKIDIFASTEEDISMLKGLFEQAEPVKESSPVIRNIIQEEVWGYFNGQKDVNDVADVIQNRVSIYLNE